ncbi:MAG: PAS domain S-box protein, partial [Ghiorsea sp.]|nr:PAS domain S-box protein [Ghiorsea sp.]
MYNSDTETLQIRQEQVRLLYKASLAAAIATAFAACFLAYLQWQHIDQSTIIIWLSIMAMVIVIRVFYYYAFKQHKPNMQEIAKWEKAYVFVSLAAGTTWGAAGIFLFPVDNFQYQATIIVILAGMAAGAVTTLSALRAPVFIFIFLTMSPLIVQLFLESSQISVPFAILCAVYTLFLANAASNTYKTHLENITLRIKSLVREETIRKSEQFMRQTSEVLEMIAKGKPASNIYDAIALLYESRHPGMRCSMLELHGNKLMHGGAPSFPQSYCDAVNGLENGPDIGSCGTSTYTGERVLVEDIATDPKWEKLKDVALPHGMRSCWSEPIKDNKGKVLGAFGMYYNHAALPNADELEDLEAGARLAGIVMARQQRETLLQKLHSAFEHVHDAIMISDLEARLEYVNPAFEKMTGYSAQEAVGQFIKILRSNQHPENFYEQLETQEKAGE